MKNYKLRRFFGTFLLVEIIFILFVQHAWSSPEIKRLNIRDCEIGTSIWQANNLGVDNAIIVSKENGCKVSYKKEKEFAYSVYECIVPSNYEYIELKDLENPDIVCKLLKTGNFFGGHKNEYNPSSVSKP